MDINDDEALEINLERFTVSLIGRHHGCMKAYSEDLRQKIVEAVDRGMSKTQAASTFGVSRFSVKRYVFAARYGKSLAPKRHPGSKPKLDERARGSLEDDVQPGPAASLKERCLFMRRVTGVSVSESTVSRLLRWMSFTRRGWA